MQNAHSKEKQKRSLLDQDNHANDQNQQRTITTTLIFKQERPCNPKILRIVNIPGWAATVIKQAVLLLGCCDLHFLQRLGSTRSFLGRVHSRMFGSGGKMRLRVDSPFSLYSKKKNRERKNTEMTQVKQAYQSHSRFLLLAVLLPQYAHKCMEVSLPHHHHHLQKQKCRGRQLWTEIIFGSF